MQKSEDIKFNEIALKQHQAALTKLEKLIRDGCVTDKNGQWYNEDGSLVKTEKDLDDKILSYMETIRSVENLLKTGENTELLTKCLTKETIEALQKEKSLELTISRKLSTLSELIEAQLKILKFGIRTLGITSMGPASLQKTYDKINPEYISVLKEIHGRALENMSKHNGDKFVQQMLGLRNPYSNPPEDPYAGAQSANNFQSRLGKTGHNQSKSFTAALTKSTLEAQQSP